MKRPDWYVRLHNPGGLLWWPGYLAWRWFKICWVGHRHRPRRVELLDDCDMFWDAEEFGMRLHRHPELWDELESVELEPPPDDPG